MVRGRGGEEGWREGGRGRKGLREKKLLMKEERNGGWGTGEGENS